MDFMRISARLHTGTFDLCCHYLLALVVVVVVVVETWRLGPLEKGFPNKR